MSATHHTLWRHFFQPVDVGIVNVEVEDEVDQLPLRFSIGISRPWFGVDRDCVDRACVHCGVVVEKDFDGR